MRRKSFFPASRIRVELITQIGRHIFVRTVQRCFVAVWYRPRHPWRPMPMTDSRPLPPPRMLAHRHQIWNNQDWSHVLFNCWRVHSQPPQLEWACPSFRRIVASKRRMEFVGMTTRMVEADPRLVIEYHLRPMLLVPVWGLFANIRRRQRWSAVSPGHQSRCLGRYPAVTKRLWTMWQRQSGVQFAWSAPPWYSTLRKNSFASWHGEGHDIPDSKVHRPTWGPPGSCRPQMGPMLVPWILLSGIFLMWSSSKDARVVPG